MGRREKRAPTPLDPTPFGKELAGRVAKHLEKGGLVAHTSCAHGMARIGADYAYELLKDRRQAVFQTPDRQAFAAWLAGESAASLDARVRPATSDVVEILDAARLESAVSSGEGIEDPTPYGRALAENVARALARGGEVAYDHRDYCGTGLCRVGDEYRYGYVNDGQQMDAIRSFRREEFVAWLAVQSDLSLSGRDEESPFAWGNQRITRSRLEALVAGADRA